MLSINVMSSGQENYYLNLAQEDYYLNGGEPEGRWYGSGAANLKLRGTVKAKALRAVMRGYSPGGKALVRNAVKKQPKQTAEAAAAAGKGDNANAQAESETNKRKKKKKVRDPGWDLTFSVPKSVSVVWSQANLRLRKTIEACIEKAFHKSVAYLEEEAAFCRIGKGGKKKVKAKLTVAAFVHGTSRTLDPQYHIHGLFLNAGLCPDGKYRALSSIDLFRHKMAAGAFFRAALAHLLQEELGVKIVRPTNKKGDLVSWFEIDGVSESLKNEFSKRREMIKAALGKLGLESAEAAAIATLDTRKKKGTIPPREELFAMWREVGKQHGFTQTTIKKLLGRVKKQTARKQASRYKKALREAVDYITRSESHFTEMELIRRTFEAAQGWGLEPEFVMKSVRRDLQDPKMFIKLSEDNNPTRFTTKKVMDLEELLIGSVDKLHESVFHPLDADLVESIIANPLYPNAKSMMDKLKVKAGMGGKSVKLSEEQARALRYLTGSEGRIKVINGLAGTGKTTLLSAMEEAYRRQGYNIIGCSVAGVAAQGLQSGAGIASDTVAMRQRQLSPGLAWTFKHHAKQMWRAARKKRTYGLNRLKIDRRTVLVVDEAGMLGTEDFAKLARAVQKGGGILICVGDHRQLPSISAGGGFEYVAKRVGQVDLQEIGRQTDHLQRELVKALVRGESKLALNLLAECGQLKVSENQDKTAERMIEDWKSSGGVEQPKDHVIVVATNREVEHYNNLAQRELAQAGKLDLKQPVKVGEETMYPGDRILFTERSRKLGVENGDRGVLVGVKDWGVGVTVAVRLDRNEQTVLIPLHRVIGESFHDFQRGYAFTTHKLQGATVDHSYIHVGGRMTTKEMAYVQFSRNRESIRIYTEKLEAGRELTKLAREHEKQVVKREQKQERQEKLLQKLQKEQRYEQERREELVNTPMPTVDREREKETVLPTKPEPNENFERTRQEERKPSQEPVREEVSKLVPGHDKATFEKLHLEQQSKQEFFPKQNPTVEREGKPTPKQQPFRERKPDYMQIHDLPPAELPEIGRERPADSRKPVNQDRTEEIDQSRKQDAKVSRNASGERQLETEQQPSREILPTSGLERQAEMQQSPRQETSVEPECTPETGRKVEPEPIRESISKVEQRQKPELSPTPRQVSQSEQVHSRKKLPRLDREKTQEPVQTPTQAKKLEQDTSQEIPKSLEPEKKQELPQPLKPEQKVAPKREKEVSPLVKQMTESGAKKLAHEIQAEAQERQREQQRDRDMKIDR